MNALRAVFETTGLAFKTIIESVKWMLYAYAVGASSIIASGWYTSITNRHGIRWPTVSSSSAWTVGISSSLLVGRTTHAFRRD